MAEKKRKPEIRFKGFVDDWEKCMLREIADIIGGGTPSTNNPEYWDGDIDWYSPTEIGKDIYANGSTKKITSLGLEKSSAKMLPPDKTVLFTSRAGIGDMAILKRTGATNQGFQSLVLKDEINPYFIYSAGHLIKKYALINASGSTFLEISGKLLGNMEINTPSSSEQNKIGEHFKSLDNLIILHQHKYNKLANVKKAMLEKMFPKDGADVPEIRFKGFAYAWEERKLGDLSLIGDIDHRMPESVTDGIPYLMTGDFVGINELNFENAKLISIKDYDQLSKKIKPEAGDILFARYASVGAVRYVETQIKFLISYSCAILKQNAAVNGEYLFYYLQASEIQRQIEIEINTGSQRNIGIDSLKKFVLLLPQEKEQQKIATFFKQLNNNLILQQREIEKLNNIKKSMLEKMFV